LDEAKVPLQGSRSTPALLVPDSSRAPDLFLRLKLDHIHEEGWITRSLQATVKASLGTAPWQSNHSIIDDTTPPLISLQWTAELRHDGQVKGVETPKYRSAAADIANQLANAVTNEILKLAREHGTLPRLPDDLYGPYRPAPNLPLPAELKAERACSYYGLLTHNETFWRLHATTNPVPQLEALMRQLAAAQWRTETLELTNSPHYYLRAKKGDAALEVFNPSAYTQPEINAAPPQSLDLIAHYREPLARAERSAALDPLLSSQTPVDTLLLFQRSYSSPQRSRLNELLEQNPTASPDACLILARDQLARKQTNSAITMLVRAKALAKALGDNSGVESKVDSLAREIRPKGRLPLEVTPDIYRALGFAEITNAPQKLEIEKALGSPVMLFSVDDNGQAWTLALRVDPPAGQSSLAAWTCTQTAPGRLSTSSGQLDLARPSGWNQGFTLGAHPVQARLTRVGTGQGVRYEMEIAPAASHP
jgi:hypothetical protein